MPFKEMREYPRNHIEAAGTVNVGDQYYAVDILDICPGGAAVQYPHDTTQADDHVAVGQVSALILQGVLKIGAKVIRIFDGGFALKFNKPFPTLH